MVEAGKIAGDVPLALAGIADDGVAGADERAVNPHGPVAQARCGEVERNGALGEQLQERIARGGQQAREFVDVDGQRARGERADEAVDERAAGRRHFAAEQVEHALFTGGVDAHPRDVECL